MAVVHFSTFSTILDVFVVVNVHNLALCECRSVTTAFVFYKPALCLGFERYRYWVLGDIRRYRVIFGIGQYAFWTPWAIRYFAVTQTAAGAAYSG